MPEMKTLGGYEVVDAKAREDITGLRNELPTKISQLENDSKFITREEVPEVDLSEYITENELLAKGYLTEHQDISGKADKVHSHPEYLTEHQSLADYAKKSEIPDVSDFITNIPDEYITESELDAKLDPIEASIAAIEADCPETYFIDFSNATVSFQEATEHMNKFASKYVYGDNKEVIVMMKTPSSQYYYPAIMTLYGNGYEIIMTPIAINPNSIDTAPLDWEVIHLKLTDVNNKWQYCLFAEAKAKTLVSKEYVDEAIANIEPPEADLTGYATEEYVTNAIASVQGIETINVTGATSTATAIHHEAIDVIYRLASGEKLCICLKDGTTYYYPAWYASSSNTVNIQLPTTFDSGNGVTADKINSTMYRFTRSDNQWTVIRSQYTKDLDWEV